MKVIGLERNWVMNHLTGSNREKGRAGNIGRETARMKSEIRIDSSLCNIQFKQMSHSGEGCGGGSGGRRGTDAYDLLNIIRPMKTRRL